MACRTLRRPVVVHPTCNFCKLGGEVEGSTVVTFCSPHCLAETLLFVAWLPLLTFLLLRCRPFSSPPSLSTKDTQVRCLLVGTLDVPVVEQDRLSLAISGQSSTTTAGKLCGVGKNRFRFNCADSSAYSSLLKRILRTGP